MTTIKENKQYGTIVHCGTGGNISDANTAKEIFTIPEVWSTSSINHSSVGVWSPSGPPCPAGQNCVDQSFTGSTLNHPIDKLATIKRWIKPSEWRMKVNTTQDTKKNINKLKNLNHDLSLHKEVDEIFKTITDYDLFSILIEGYLVNNDLVDRYYKSLSRSNSMYRSGPGLYQFLEEGNVYPYNPYTTSVVDSLKSSEDFRKSLKGIWVTIPKKSSTIQIYTGEKGMELIKKGGI